MTYPNNGRQNGRSDRYTNRSVYNENNSGNQDIYEQEYQRQLEQFSRMDNENFDDGVDLQFHQPGEDNYDYHDYYDEGYEEDYIRQDRRAQYTKRPDANGQSAPHRQTGNSSRQNSKPSRSKSRTGSDNNLQFGANNHNRPQSKNKNKKQSSKKRNSKVENKKRHPVKTFFKVLIIIILILFILANLLIWRYIGMVNTVKRGERSVTNASMSDSDVRNILVIGSDTRSVEQRGRTDSMILLSVNSKTKEITMTSFMRDMYVEIVGKDADGNDIDTWDKMNAAYVYGGAELLMDTIEYNFDISVDDYVYIDFYSFVDIVDAIGGIEIEISDEEAEGMKPPMAEQNKILGNEKGTDYLEHGGKLTLNGNQALAYARLRYVGNADFERTERQRTVISKIIEKVKSSSPLTIDKFAKASMSHLATNMSKAELYALTYKAIFSLNYDINSLRIPDDDSYTYGNHSGQSTLDVDFEKCRQLLRENIYK